MSVLLPYIGPALGVLFVLSIGVLFYKLVEILPDELGVILVPTTLAFAFIILASGIHLVFIYLNVSDPIVEVLQSSLNFIYETITLIIGAILGAVAFRGKSGNN